MWQNIWGYRGCAFVLGRDRALENSEPWGLATMDGMVPYVEDLHKWFCRDGSNFVSLNYKYFASNMAYFKTLGEGEVDPEIYCLTILVR